MHRTGCTVPGAEVAGHRCGDPGCICIAHIGGVSEAQNQADIKFHSEWNGWVGKVYTRHAVVADEWHGAARAQLGVRRAVAGWVRAARRAESRSAA